MCCNQALYAVSSHRGLMSVMLTGPFSAVWLAEISILYVSSSVCCLSIMTFNQQASAMDTSSLSSETHTHLFWTVKWPSKPPQNWGKWQAKVMKVNKRSYSVRHTCGKVCSIGKACRMSGYGRKQVGQSFPVVHFLCCTSKTFRVALKKKKKWFCEFSVNSGFNYTNVCSSAFGFLFHYYLPDCISNRQWRKHVMKFTFAL